MKTFICLLALAFTVEAGLLGHGHGHGHIDEYSAHYDAGHHHSDVHIAQSPAIVIEENGVSIAAATADVHHADVHHHDLPAAKIVHHEPIHQVEPVHHVTKVVHHEPHHFLHYTKPVVDHHYQREVAYTHVHSAPLVIADGLHHSHAHSHHADLYAHGGSHLAYYSSLGKHLHHYAPYSKLRVIEKHY
ncbi:histidine-rich glycoprotein [Eupeodes corollae]|uniref:histidine-rich glycoprotein n=1 Tax=Eupeodes corollae TaxID=290404 RepID=UPI002491F837|nr:histidine-rich glycoprotein [Eupeodes corollae]